MESLTLQPIKAVNGEITLPGSKSLSNRILLLSALAEGNTHITNLLDSDDIRHMLSALKAAGVPYSLNADKTECMVEGQHSPLNLNKGENNLELFLGNAGTAMRPLTAAFCMIPGEFVLTGEPRMFERPIKDLVDALRQIGGDIEYLKDEGYPPAQNSRNRPARGDSDH